MIMATVFTITSISLCACEEKVAIDEYESIQDELDKVKNEYNSLLQHYAQLQVQHSNLSNSVNKLENEYNELQRRVNYAKTKAEVLESEFESWFCGHWALSFGDIANDAYDVKRALNGSQLIIRIRTKNGVEY